MLAAIETYQWARQRYPKARSEDCSYRSTRKTPRDRSMSGNSGRCTLGPATEGPPRG